MESSRAFISHLLPCAEYSANNAFYYNGNNGTLNNNDKNNRQSCRGVLELEKAKTDFESFPIPLSEFYRVYRKTKQHKARKPSHLVFKQDYPRHLRELCYEINNRTYTPTTSIAFIVTKPKYREVIAADFRDRVAQTLLVQEILPALEKYEHPHSYSCRVGKGCLKAVERLQDLNLKYRNGVVCFIDLANFFMSIDVEYWIPRLVEFMRDKLPKGERTDVMVSLAEHIYYHRAVDDCIKMSPQWMWDEYIPARKSLYKSKTGVPIGNVTSQTLANFVTTPFLKLLESLLFEFCFYTDDTGFFVTKEDKDRLLSHIPYFKQFLWDECRLKLHPDKIYIQDVQKGFNAFGFRIKRDNITPSKRIVHSFKRLVYYLLMLAEEDVRNIYLYRDKAAQRLNSYLGLLSHCHSFNLRREQIIRLQHSKWSSIFQFPAGFAKVGIRSDKTRLMYFRRQNRIRKRQSTLIYQSI